MDRFSELNEFIAVVEAGGFSAAARRRGEGQPAISKAIAALEKRLGVALFNRSTRSVSALLCGRLPFAGHAERDAFALRLLTRCAFGSLESFRDFRGGLFAGRTLQKPNFFLRPRSPCRNLFRSRCCLRHVWFSLADPTYLARFACFASSRSILRAGSHFSALEDVARPLLARYR
jgi:Bacterial regulatory helix-turn-helix protein, lysR family